MSRSSPQSFLLYLSFSTRLFWYHCYSSIPIIIKEYVLYFIISASLHFRSAVVMQEQTLLLACSWSCILRLIFLIQLEPRSLLFTYPYILTWCIRRSSIVSCVLCLFLSESPFYVLYLFLGSSVSSTRQDQTISLFQLRLRMYIVFSPHNCRNDAIMKNWSKCCTRQKRRLILTCSSMCCSCQYCTFISF